MIDFDVKQSHTYTWADEILISRVTRPVALPPGMHPTLGIGTRHWNSSRITCQNWYSIIYHQESGSWSRYMASFPRKPTSATGVRSICSYLYVVLSRPDFFVCLGFLDFRKPLLDDITMATTLASRNWTQPEKYYVLLAPCRESANLQRLKKFTTTCYVIFVFDFNPK